MNDFNDNVYELTPEVIKNKLKLLPDEPGCYLMKGKDNNILYIGKAKILKNRVRQYFHKSTDMTRRIRRLVFMIADFDIIITNSELEALILESNLIKKHKPQFNVMLRDDKSYPYIVVTLSEEYPRILLKRKLNFSKDDKDRYYGPYTDSNAIRETINLIHQIFKVPCGYKEPEKAKGKGCLYYHINQCIGVCAGKANHKDYMLAISDVMSFLDGKRKELTKDLKKRMEISSENLEFEKAAKIRDQIKAIERLSLSQQVSSTSNEDKDIIALAFNEKNACVSVMFYRGGHIIGQNKLTLDFFDSEDLPVTMYGFLLSYYRYAKGIPKEIYVNITPEDENHLEEWLTYLKGSKVNIIKPQRGNRKELLSLAIKNALEHVTYLSEKEERDKNISQQTLEELAHAIGMSHMPTRIETYDISNIQGINTVASLVTFIDGKPIKKLYRKFKINISEGKPDDFASMKEVISRRINGSLRKTKGFEHLPDLFLIDGGLGQLSSAAEVLEENNITDKSIIGLAKKEEVIYTCMSNSPVILPKRSKALMLLQRMRDEAHRFAITYHRSLRNKNLTSSILNKIDGIGPKRRKALLSYFKNIDNIKDASIEEICNVDGINLNFANKIKGIFDEIADK